MNCQLNLAAALHSIVASLRKLAAIDCAPQALLGSEPGGGGFE